MSEKPDPRNNPENQYAIGRRMKVRKLQGEYEIIDSRMLGQNRRYDLRAIPGTGAALMATEAWGADMQLAPEPVAASQEPASPAGQSEPAPDAEHGTTDAVSGLQASPGAGSDPYYELDAGAFGGELDPYSPGAQHDWEPDAPGELQEPDPLKIVRRFPEPLKYVDLRSIVYNARLKGLEDKTSKELDELDKGTPVAVALSHETNGHTVWVITVEGEDLRICHLEAFYPHATGSSADATEYAVLIALRQIPIRTGVVETSRLVF